MNKLSQKTKVRLEILAALRRATAQAKILNKIVNDIHNILESNSAKKAA